MRHQSIFAALLVGLSLLLSACPCEPESDAQLCGDNRCGLLQFTDRCGDTRQVDCGGCDDPAECEANQCVCEPELDVVLCANEAAACGDISVTDRCGDERTIDCGSCPDVGECIDNTCRCDDEPVTSLCDIAQAQCGQTSVTDSCGILRDINCGDCTAPDECTDNQCECFAESDDELCADHSGQCGPLEIIDRCNQTRQLECAPCSVGNSTLGAIRDAATGEFVDDALIRVYEWPPVAETNDTWTWTAGYRANDPDFSANSTADDVADQVNYELASGDAICLENAASASLTPHQWYRIRIDRPGYEPTFFYRYHRGFDYDDCPSLCPADDDSGCRRWDFEIWPDDTTYPRYPNLAVDFRNLYDQQWQCAHLPDGSTHERVIGLRTAGGVANTGQGPFHLEGAPGGDDGQGIVLQHITYSDGSSDTVEVDSDTFDYNASGQPRFMIWLHLGLVDPIDACRDLDDRPASCLSHDHPKRSFCLIDSDPFDEDIMLAYGSATPTFTDPPTCATGEEQGITPGWKDVYGNHLPGQFLILGPPEEASQLGTRWLEAIVDPEQVLNEETRRDNVARIPVDVPSDTASLCDDPTTTLDCTVPPPTYDNDQRWSCPRYLDYGQ